MASIRWAASLLAVVVVFASSADGGIQDQTEPQIVQKLKRVLEVRDQQLSTMRVPFTAKSEAYGDSTYIGTWKQVGKHRALTYVFTQKITGESVERPPQYVHTYTDGIEWRDFTRKGGVGVLTLDVRSPRNFFGFVPLNFGLTYFMDPWPLIIEQSEVKVIGRESFAGVDCLRLIATPRRYGKNRRALDILIDDRETLLVWKCVDFKGKSANPRHDSPAVITHLESGELKIDDAVMHPTVEFRLEKAQLLGRVHFPMKGELRTPMLTPPVTTEVTVDAAGLTLDPGLTVSALREYDVGDASDTVVQDLVTGKSTLSSKRLAHMGPGQEDFETLLSRISQSEGLVLSKPTGTSESLLEVSCGPSALYAWMRLHNLPLSLDDIKKACTNWGAETTMAELAAASSRLGTPMVPMRVHDNSVLQQLGLFLAIIHRADNHHGSDERDGDAHYVLCKADGKSIRMYSPPKDAWNIPLTEFHRVWNGEVLVRAENSKVAKLNLGLPLSLLSLTVAFCVYLAWRLFHKTRSRA